MFSLPRHIFKVVSVFLTMWVYSVSPQVVIKDIEFIVENGIRGTRRVLATSEAPSMVECAARCLEEGFCSDFNFRPGQCELMSAVDSCRITAPGWSHGYECVGKSPMPTRAIKVYTIDKDTARENSGIIM